MDFGHMCVVVLFRAVHWDKTEKRASKMSFQKDFTFMQIPRTGNGILFQSAFVKP